MQNSQITPLFKAVAVLGLFGIAGCDLLKSPVAVSADRPAATAAPPDAPASAASQALRAYYSSIQTELVSQGLLRTDGGDGNAPFTDSNLAENFVRIAAYDEFSSGPDGLTQSEKPSRIRKWVTPVRIGLRFGASVGQAQRTKDTARVAAYVVQLARATGHPISLDTTAPNFLVEIINEDERAAIGPVASAALDQLTAADLANIINMPQSTYCQVYTQTRGKSDTYVRAFAVIRAEHPDLLRLSCLHEEIAQGLGLANDSPRARPSIFNDNDEFALLTPQDELMLRMLYDRRMIPGMTAEQARPVAVTLATQFMGGES